MKTNPPNHPKFMRLVGSFSMVALSVFGLLWLVSCTVADRLIFMPPPASYPRDAPGLLQLRTPRGEAIAAFHFKAAAGMPTALYSHGNAEDIGQSDQLYQALRARGWGVLAYDYPGYGQSTGEPDERGCEQAIETAWLHLTGAEGVAPEDIVIMGRSVGSGPSVWLAARRSCRALVLISPFTSTFAVMPPAHRVVPGDRFPNLRRIKGITTPLLVIHGENDSVIPLHHGRQLHDASPASHKQFVTFPGTDHNDLYATRLGEVIAALDDFAGP